MNSFWHPPVLQGTKGACTSTFIWISTVHWKWISWQTLSHFIPAQDLGQPWSVQTGLLPVRLHQELLSKQGGQPTALPWPWHLGTAVPTAGKSRQNWCSFSLWSAALRAPYGAVPQGSPGEAVGSCKHRCAASVTAAARKGKDTGSV